MSLVRITVLLQQGYNFLFMVILSVLCNGWLVHPWEQGGMKCIVGDGFRKLNRMFPRDVLA